MIICNIDTSTIPHPFNSFPNKLLNVLLMYELIYIYHKCNFVAKYCFPRFPGQQNRLFVSLSVHTANALYHLFHNMLSM